MLIVDSVGTQLKDQMQFRLPQEGLVTASNSPFHVIGTEVLLTSCTATMVGGGFAETAQEDCNT
jgi:hypothetical protein